MDWGGSVCDSTQVETATTIMLAVAANRLKKLSVNSENLKREREVHLTQRAGVFGKIDTLQQAVVLKFLVLVAKKAGEDRVAAERRAETALKKLVLVETELLDSHAESASLRQVQHCHA